MVGLFKSAKCRLSSSGFLSLVILTLLSGCVGKTKGPEGEFIPKVYSEAKGDSFWRDRVEYAFDVEYVDIIDSNKRIWELAYHDVYWGSGDRDDAETVVLIHGRCANMGYFSQMIKALASEGLRVVAVDLPNYGKSLPGNIEQTVQRSLESSREIVHLMLSSHLEIEQFHLFGHSMGGQWAIGYALKYPKSVSSLLLESTYGLEEYPSEFWTSDGESLNLFDPALANDLDQWGAVWNSLGHLDAEMSRTEAEIQSSHYFKKFNPQTGELEESSVGLFKSLNQDSAFFTEARVQSAVGNLAEYDRFITTCVRDIYAMGVETRKEDPRSLTKRLALLRVPVVMMFGGLDPFLPNKALTGHSDLMGQVVRPAYIRLSAAGYPPIVVFYEESGHIPHVDAVGKLSEDVVSFIREGEVVSEPVDPGKAISH
ncbi:alpha/beta hydrolase [Hahella ganghwensis]|uniref:alpha/beta hydrolase n=1 Tax=Hahella ganghwensis TaxID=286420 RepID=UPI00037A2649|nr:alpha/beta fold hydrolase [Hahella ganghwensis]